MSIRSVILVGLFVLIGGLKAHAQEPVQWSYSAKPLSNGTYEIKIAATIQDGWHIYSQQQPDDAIALPTSIKFTKSPLLELEGATKEVGALDAHVDPTLGTTSNQYVHKVDFVQVVKLKAKAQTNITGTIQFQVCTDKECLPPATAHFAIPLK